MNKFYYYGDINLENGGMFIELPNDDDWQQDYATVTEIVDMDSATNLIMINNGSIYISSDFEKRNQALPVIGATLLTNGAIDDNGTIRINGTFDHWLCLAMAFHAYHGIDSDCWDGETYVLTATVDKSELPDDIEIEHVLGDDESLEDYIGLSISDSETGL
jgi:hypothetical protein